MKYCSNCGAQLPEDQMFCNQCGTRQEQQTHSPQYTQAPRNAQPMKFSDWDGSVFDTFINSLAASLMITFTCGIATPWAICYVWRFILGHVTLDGKRLTFDGTGGQLFGNWLKWLLLTVITCGIYSFWVAPRLYKWVASHTHFAE